MDEHHDSALHYGHVGRAVYLPEEQAWTFTRSFAQGRCLESYYCCALLILGKPRRSCILE